ncbi:hypothetical protein L0V05_02255 [Tabrizicola sp. J26]|uniref:hypothetical protein n=1 Tax=Alitabrizicola rongguiensis TaxID=2909234 RepID=UPI001F20351A|nr:hypothetical protein [Tabrizicola rongguiensis]MCF1707631.1 hypothetical protein [Tabrizicola rongguiensis]
MLSIEDQTIVYRQPQLPWALRLFMLILGLSLAIGMPLPFFIHLDWLTPSPMILIGLAFMVIPPAMGGFLLAAALWSAAELRIDPATGWAQRILRGPFVNRSDQFPLADLAVSDVIMRDSDDGTYPLLRVSMPGRRRLDMACFFDRAEAEQWRARIERALRP